MSQHKRKPAPLPIFNKGKRPRQALFAHPSNVNTTSNSAASAPYGTCAASDTEQQPCGGAQQWGSETPRAREGKGGGGWYASTTGSKQNSGQSQRNRFQFRDSQGPNKTQHEHSSSYSSSYANKENHPTWSQQLPPLTPLLPPSSHHPHQHHPTPPSHPLPPPTPHPTPHPSATSRSSSQWQPRPRPPVHMGGAGARAGGTQQWGGQTGPGPQLSHTHVHAQHPKSSSFRNEIESELPPALRPLDTGASGGMHQQQCFTQTAPTTHPYHHHGSTLTQPNKPHGHQSNLSATPTTSTATPLPAGPRTTGTLVVVTATAKGIEHWSGCKQHCNLLFEVFGTLSSPVRMGSFNAKEFFVKTPDGVFKCLFWEMDRALPMLQGVLRVVGSWDPKKSCLKCFSVRPALPGEDKFAGERIEASDRAMRMKVATSTEQ